MYDIRNMNIWETTPNKQHQSGNDTLRQGRGNDGTSLLADIEVLNLSVRSFNCLKRAGCQTVQDIIDLLDTEEGSLRRVRNLGARSEAEILEAVTRFRELAAPMVSEEEGNRALVRPRQGSWNRSLEEFDLSKKALDHLHECGVRKVGNLYRSTLPAEPGWYAVRELFEQIAGR